MGKVYVCGLVAAALAGKQQAAWIVHSWSAGHSWPSRDRTFLVVANMREREYTRIQAALHLDKQITAWVTSNTCSTDRVSLYIYIHSKNRLAGFSGDSTYKDMRMPRSKPLLLSEYFGDNDGMPQVPMSLL
jgi:hypothetical protein